MRRLNQMMLIKQIWGSFSQIWTKKNNESPPDLYLSCPSSQKRALNLQFKRKLNLQFKKMLNV